MAWKEPIGRPNWIAGLGVLDGHVQQRWAPPTCSAARATAARSSVARQRRPGAALLPDQAGRRPREFERGLLAGLVHGGERRARHAGGVGLHGEEAHTLAGAADHQDQVRRGAVDHEHLVAVELPLAARARGRQCDAVEVPATGVLGQRQGGDGLPGGDAREKVLLGALVPAGQKGVGGQGHRREVGGAQQGAAHLLEDHGELDVAESDAAVLLGNGDGLEAELFPHLLPDGRVVALGRLHEPPHLGHG